MQQFGIVFEFARAQRGILHRQLPALVISSQRAPCIAWYRLQAEALTDRDIGGSVDSQLCRRPADDLEEGVADVVPRPPVCTGDHDAEVEQVLGVVLHAHALGASEVEVHLRPRCQLARGELCTEGLSVREDAGRVALQGIGVDQHLPLGPGSGGLEGKVRRHLRVGTLELLDIAREVLPDLQRLARGHASLADRAFDPYPAALAGVRDGRREQLDRSLERKAGRHVAARPVLDAQARGIVTGRFGLRWAAQLRPEQGCRHERAEQCQVNSHDCADCT